LIINKPSFVISEIMAFAFRISPLPREFRTEEAVIGLIENSLSWGQIKTVKIISNTAQNGAIYSSAIVHMQNWSNTASRVLEDATAIGRHSVSFASDSGLTHSWDNGKPMSHITFKFFAENSVNETHEPQVIYTRALSLADGEWSSLHIPIIPTGLGVKLKNGWVEYVNEHSMKTFIEERLRIGKVKRIDFVERDDIDVNPHVKAAFIHFDYWFDNKNVAFLRNRLNSEGRFRQKGFYDGTEMRNFFVESSAGGETPTEAYFVFKINHRPIPDADDCGLNIHQLAAIKTKLEGTIDTLTKEVEELRKQLEQKETDTPAVEIA
jgi:hypothetical protein